MSDDPYVYPGTDILINKEDIRDADELRRVETEITAIGMQTLPFDIPPTYEGYRRIHRHLFEPLYAWAGEVRTVNIAKGGHMFCLVPHIGSQMERRFAALASENNLKGLPRDEFVARAAAHIAEINAIHPFREGNGRTLRAFLEIIGQQAGYRVALRHIDPDAWNRASITSFRDANYDDLRHVIDKAVIGRHRPPPDRHRTRDDDGRGR